MKVNIKNNYILKILNFKISLFVIDEEVSLEKIKLSNDKNKDIDLKRKKNNEKVKLK